MDSVSTANARMTHALNESVKGMERASKEIARLRAELAVERSNRPTRDFEEAFIVEAQLYSKEVGDYDLPVYAQPKERAHQGRSKIKTRTWESTIAEAVTESAPAELPAGRLSLQVVFLTHSASGDLSNLIKSLEDALNGRAYVDDKQIDHILATRVVRPNQPERILVRIYEKP